MSTQTVSEGLHEAQVAAVGRVEAVEVRIERELLVFLREHPMTSVDGLRAGVVGQNTVVDRVRRRLEDEGRIRRRSITGYVVAGELARPKGGKR